MRKVIMPCPFCANPDPADIGDLIVCRECDATAPAGVWNLRQKSRPAYKEADAGPTPFAGRRAGLTRT